MTEEGSREGREITGGRAKGERGKEVGIRGGGEVERKGMRKEGHGRDGRKEEKGESR